LSNSVLTGSDGAHASRGNLMGFLDAFKAIPASPESQFELPGKPAWLFLRSGPNAPSLTHCEDFA